MVPYEAFKRFLSHEAGPLWLKGLLWVDWSQDLILRPSVQLFRLRKKDKESRCCCGSQVTPAVLSSEFWVDEYWVEFFAEDEGAIIFVEH